MKKLFVTTLLILLSPLALAKDPEVIIRTSMGDFTLRLYAEQAPLTVENFLAYVDSGYYSNTVFHRVIPNFMIQGGGMTAQIQEKPGRGEPVKNEARNRLHNERGTIAMARTNDPDSATSQFFINVRNNFNLDWSPNNPGYTVFGQVIDGMHVVDAIKLVKTGNVAGHQNVPLQPVILKEAVRAP